MASERPGHPEATREANGQKLKKQKRSGKGDQDQGKRNHGIREVRVLNGTERSAEAETDTRQLGTEKAR